MSVNGIEPHAISITVEPALAAEAGPMMNITVAKALSIATKGGNDDIEQFCFWLGVPFETEYDAMQ